MTTEPHDHHRPDTADMLASLAAARHILLGQDQAAHDTAEAGTCPACTTIAGASFMITTVSTILGDKVAVSERTRQVLLAAIDAAEAEIRAAPN